MSNLQLCTVCKTRRTRAGTCSECRVEAARGPVRPPCKKCKRRRGRYRGPDDGLCPLCRAHEWTAVNRPGLFAPSPDGHGQDVPDLNDAESFL